MSHGKKIFGEPMITSMNHITLGVTNPEMRIDVKKADAGHWKNVEWFI